MKDFGLLIVDKPIGPTSHKIVSIVRNGTGIRKVGHAGTLDPRASGVLVLCLGSATRLSEYLSNSSKCYHAVITFGSSTRTYDADGEITRHTGQVPDLEVITKALQDFIGEIQQVPPPYSAIKVQGKKAYELARRGQEPDLEPRRVIIESLDVAGFNPPELTLQVECSAGTYIRSLAHDLGEKLSTGAHLSGLRRTRAGPFTLQDTVSFSILEESLSTGEWQDYIRPAADALPDLPEVNVDDRGLALLRNGHRLEAEAPSSGLARAIGPDGELVAILEAVTDGREWHPRKVFLT
jgi:tRNA pseudouridine55 synthase